MILRRLTSNDLELTFDARNDPAVYRWCRQNAPLHWANHLQWFEWQANDPSVSMFAVTVNDVLVGVCGLTDIDMVNRRAEFSHYTVPKHQGKGIAKDALAKLFYHGFNDLGLNRIWGETFDGNPAYHLFHRYLGMELEGTRKDFYYNDGRYIDAHLFSISATNFNALFPDETGL